MNRRALLTKIGTLCATSVAAYSAQAAVGKSLVNARNEEHGLLEQNSEKAAERASITNVVLPGDDLQKMLNEGAKLIVLSPMYNYTFTNITIPSGVTILGNGATVNSADNNSGIFRVHNADRVFIYDVNFVGSSVITYTESLNKDHVALDVYKSANVTIDNCRFYGFLGAGVNMFNYYPGVLNRTINMKVTNCSFVDCQYGFMAWYMCEYGVLNGNHFSQCNCAIWNNSGNWVISGNSVTDCHASYICVNGVNDIAFSAGRNHAHGNITGNTFNHARESRWARNPLYYNSTIKQEGVMFDGVLPPTYSGNAHWHTDVSFSNSEKPFYMTGCTYSLSTITNNSSGIVHLTGCWLNLGTLVGEIKEV